jgi:hypothetical protein
MPLVPIAPHQGGFGSVRKHDIHAGVDLYVAEGMSVFAVKAGQVKEIGRFTGAGVGTPWWNETWAVLVEGVSGGILYGEIEPAPVLDPGSWINEGALLGTVRRVLRKDKGLPTSMLHIQLHLPGCRNVWDGWEIGGERPQGLLDPTPMLLKCVELARASSSLSETPLPPIRLPGTGQPA